MTSLTGNLIDLIRSKPVQDDDLIAASHLVLDTVACVIGGQASAPGRILIEWFEEVGRDSGRDAFLASGLAHILEIDDLHKDSVTHPGCVVIPLAWHRRLAVVRSLAISARWRHEQTFTHCPRSRGGVRGRHARFPRIHWCRTHT